MFSVQVIRGKKLFVIIETSYGKSQSGYPHKIEEMARILKCNPVRANPNCVILTTIHTSDREVKHLSSVVLN